MPRKSTKKRKLSNSPPKEPQQQIAQKSGSCLFCGVDFEEDDSKLSNAERLKVFEATCMFLNVTSEDQTWNFEQELFPFCTSCVGYVQEFGALYDELEIVHCKIGRVVENVKLVVSSSSSSSESSKSKRTRKGSGSSSAGQNSKLVAFKEQLLATLKIGEETEGGGQDGENGSSSFRKESFPSPVKRLDKDLEKVVTSSSEDKEGDNHRSEEAGETVHEEEGNVEEMGNADDSEEEEEEEDEFIAYVKEQLEKRKAQGLANDDDEIIPVDHSVPIPKVEADDGSKDVVELHSESEENQSSTIETVNAARPKLPINEATVNSSSVDAVDKSNRGFGTVIGGRYEKYINTPKPNLSMSSVTSDGFLYGAVAVRKKGPAYQCSLCPKVVVMHDKDLILDHIEMVHIGTDHWYPCEYCEESFRLVGQLHLHRRQQHPGMRDRKWTLMCSICSKRFFSPEFATEHSDVDHKLASEKANKIIRDLEAKGRALPEISEEIEMNIPPQEDKSHDNGISIEPMPFQLRPRKTRQTYTDEGSDLEEIKVEDDDSDSDDFEESPPSRPRNRRSSIQRGQNVKIPAVDVAPIAPTVAEPPRESVIPVSKLVLCGGCGCRYFSETEAAISTIKKHGLHHKSQKAFPCRLCTGCFNSLEEMVEHVREHSQEPKFKDYVFFSPLDVA